MTEFSEKVVGFEKQAVELNPMSPYVSQESARSTDVRQIATVKTSEILLPLENPDQLPNSLNHFIELREKAGELATEINGLQGINSVISLSRISEQAKIEPAASKMTINESIVRAIHLLALHKSVHLIFANLPQYVNIRAKIPDNVRRHVQLLGEAKAGLVELKYIQGDLTFLNMPLGPVVSRDGDWKDEKGCFEQIKEMTAWKEAFEDIVPNMRRIADGYDTTRFWANEGLESDSIPNVSQQDLDRSALLLTRFFAWSVNFNKTYDDETKWDEVANVIINSCTDRTSPDILVKIKEELSLAKSSLFGDEEEY